MLGDDRLGELAARFGTPLYVYDGDVMVDHTTELRSVLHPALTLYYSLKANPNLAVVALLRAAGAHAEVSSLTELRTALVAGMTPEEIIFLGPGKSDTELRTCVEIGIHAVVCESLAELAAVDAISAEHGRRQRVLLRVNPSTAAAGARLAMGGKPRQFGIDEAVVLAQDDLPATHPHLDLAGIQVYAGTRILDPAVVAANTEYVLDLAERVADRTGIGLDAVDIGGGLGVAYFDGERDLELAELAKLVNPVLERFALAHPHTRLMMESGRFLTARMGTYLTRVRYVKESLGKRFAVTDGGTHHHMAAVGIGSLLKHNFPIRAITAEPAADHERWQVTGPLCTPNDTIGKNVSLPALRPGDLLGVLRSGAYGPTASPGLFLSHGFPAEVLVHRGEAHLVRVRDEPKDLLRQQRLPAGIADLITEQE